MSIVSEREFPATYSGYLKIPRKGGVKKGWQKVYAVLRGYELYFYTLNDPPKSNSSDDSLSSVFLVNKDDTRPNVDASEFSQVFDLRDINFHISSVTENDVIHASRAEVSHILKLTYSNDACGKASNQDDDICHQLVLADNVTDKLRWIEALRGVTRY